VKAPGFDYVRAEDLDHARALLAEYGDDARILAGGQSLVPLLNMRLASPAVLIDINRIAGLETIEQGPEGLSIGALVRHSQVMRSDRIRAQAPLLGQAIPHVAHDGVRNRGTFGGSLALADPAAELPACALALDASLSLSSNAGGERRVRARDFFLGLYQTALRPDEMLTRVALPVARPDQRFAFQEVARRHGDYAILGLAATASLKERVVGDAVLCFFATGDRPMLAEAAADCLNGQLAARVDCAEAIEAIGQDVEFTGDPQSSAELRRHLSGVLLKRAVGQLLGGLPSPAGGRLS
jgi:carbon-monoxide dehydrogenase medium subunit